MYASHIMTSPYTLTGSIGVVGSWIFSKGFNAKLGLDYDSLTRGEHADLGTGFILPKRDLSDDEEKRLRCCMLELYGVFIKKAALGRNMKEEELEVLARGRVYSGLTSQRLGLTDSLGGYLDALETARNLAGIPVSKKLKIQEYPKLKFFEKMAAKAFSSSSSEGLYFSPLLQMMKTPRLWDDLNYRYLKNGQVMPILPLSCGGKNFI
jgi:protease-4